MLRPAVPLLLVSVLALASCQSNPVAPRIEDTVFAPSLEVDLSVSTRTESGLWYRDLRVGDRGTPAVNGRVAHVRYTGWLANGEVFDGNTTALEPLRFVIGSGSVIRGWDEGIVGMRVGGVRQLIVPPHLGYGPNRRGNIPPNSILVFRVELVGLQ